jgi:transaldolase
MKTKIFLDGGDVEETDRADKLLKSAGLAGIQGQTTNPSLIAKNLARKSEGRLLTLMEALEEYRRIVREISKITSGPVSIQVTADPQAGVPILLDQARERIRWISNGVIKFPCTKNGLEAARIFSREGPVNLTLVFTQSQAAAIYAATFSHDRPHEVFVSPFVGRLDDRGENGMEVVKNILKMYRFGGDGHVQVLTASVRTLKHFLYALSLGSDAVTVPYAILDEWVDGGAIDPGNHYVYEASGLRPLPFEDKIKLDLGYTEYDFSHPLTEAGVVAFAKDWSAVLKK